MKKTYSDIRAAAAMLVTRLKQTPVYARAEEKLGPHLGIARKYTIDKMDKYPAMTLVSMVVVGTFVPGGWLVAGAYAGKLVSPHVKNMWHFATMQTDFLKRAVIDPTTFSGPTDRAGRCARYAMSRLKEVAARFRRPEV